jgi:putative glutamine amidotransferase
MVIHDVAIHSGTRLARMLGGRARVVSGHHQAAARLGTGLRAAATAADGVVEAIEATDPAVWLVAVQWHPEDPQTRDAAPGQLEAIMGAFAAACREHAAARAAGTPEQEAIR